jgi:tetratricopeptide (TPR) repeat protein
MKRAWFAALTAAIVVVVAILTGTVVVRERDYQALVIQGDAALAAGQTYQAIEAFSGAIALRSESMIAYLKRGEAYRQRGEYGAALRDLRIAARLDPSAVRPMELLGDVNYALERYARAAESYRSFVALDDRSPRVHYKLGLSLFRAGDAAGAIEPLRRAVALDDKLAEARYTLGLCLKDRGETRAALQAFEDALRLSPAMLAAREELAGIYGDLGQSRKVVEQLEAIAALEPARPERQTAVALAYAGSGRTDAAVNVLGRAAERYPDNTAIFVALGRVWLEVATPRRDRVALRKAVEALQPLARQPGASSETLALYGRAVFLLGETTAAEPILQQAAATFPIDPEALLWHAEAAERLGLLARSRASLERWAVIVPQTAEGRSAVLEKAGDMAVRVGDAQGALRAFQQAVQTNAPTATALASLARLQLSAGQRADAKATVARGLTRFPRDPALLGLQRRVE